jgi:hypothetical protein
MSLLEDMCEDQYDNYNNSDFSASSKKCGARRQQNSKKIIPEITQQRIKDKEAKKQLKRDHSKNQKYNHIFREESRSYSMRRQMLTQSELKTIEEDNELFDYEEEMIFYYYWISRSDYYE